MSKTWKDLSRNAAPEEFLPKRKKPVKHKPKEPPEAEVLNVSDLCWPDGDHTY